MPVGGLWKLLHHRNSTRCVYHFCLSSIKTTSFDQVYDVSLEVYIDWEGCNLQYPCWTPRGRMGGWINWLVFGNFTLSDKIPRINWDLACKLARAGWQLDNMYGNLWQCMAMCDKCMAQYGNVWQIHVNVWQIHGNVWQMYGTVGQCMTIYDKHGDVWQYVAKCGNQSMAMYSKVWQILLCVANYGNVWKYLGCKPVLLMRMGARQWICKTCPKKGIWSLLKSILISIQIWMKI